MTKKNSNNDPLDLFPIPNDAIYINSKKNLNPRDKIISDLNLNLDLRPQNLDIKTYCNIASKYDSKKIN